MELYLDTADFNAIEKYAAMLPLAGVTTNPTIASKGDLPLPQLIKNLRELLGPNARLHAQVLSNQLDPMLDEARKLADIDPDLVVKLPVTPVGYQAMKILAGEGQNITATAIYSAHQGFMAALCGAKYVAPYVNRIDGMTANGAQTVQDLQTMIDKNNLDCKILAASFRTAQQALDVLCAGIESITLPIDVLEQMLNHPCTAPAASQFEIDWAGAFGDRLSYE